MANSGEKGGISEQGVLERMEEDMDHGNSLMEGNHWRAKEMVMGQVKYGESFRKEKSSCFPISMLELAFLHLSRLLPFEGPSGPASDKHMCMSMTYCLHFQGLLWMKSSCSREAS